MTNKKDVAVPVTEANAETKKIVAYKGFDKNFQCRGYQFEIGKTYMHTGSIRICESGFHACENPFDVWSYYDPFGNRFAEVEQSGTTENHDKDSKIASAEITIKAELTLPEFIRRGIEWVMAACRADSATNASSGDYATNASSGHSATNASSGHSAKNASSGDYATNASSGDYAKNEATGKHSVIAAAGRNSIAKGADGVWIALAEYDSDKKCIGFATGYVGRDGLKPDTWYGAQGGKLVMV